MRLPIVMLFVPCERMVIDSITNSLTLSFVHETIQPLALTPDDDMLSQVPSENIELFKQIKFVIPPLQMLTVWNRGEIKDTVWNKGETQDEDVFEQIVTITSPDGRRSPLSPPVQFTFGEAFGHRVFQITNAIAGRLFGYSVLSVSIRKVGEQDWHTSASYPLYVEEIPKEPETPSLPSQEV